MKLANKLGGCLRRLSSDNPNEVTAAFTVINRLLQGAMKNRDDLLALADFIESPKTNGSGKLNEQEMQEIYNRGCSDERRRMENERFSSSDFHNIDGLPDWHQIARYCQENIHRLTRPNEIQFINDITARTVYRGPTPKQEKWLRSIFFRLGGKI